jgi:hypothetical protein
MSAFMLRDQALALSGLLVEQLYGEPVKPYMPPKIWSSISNNAYNRQKGPNLYRRSLYTFWRRIVGPTMFFDSAKRQVCEVKPLRTNTPMHALTILNDVTYVEAARVLAAGVLKEAAAGDDDGRLRLAGRRVLGRELLEEEKKIWRRTLVRSTAAFAADPGAAERFLAHGDSKPDPELAASPETYAAWTALCLNLLNLDETLNKE